MNLVVNWDDSGGDDDTGDGTPEHPYATVQKAISMAQDGDVVTLIASNASGNLLVTKDSKAVKEGTP